MIHMYQLNCGSKYLIIKAESGTQKFLVSKSESIKYVWPGPGYIYLDHRYTELQPAWCPSLDGGFWKHSLADSWPSLHPVPPVPSQWWCPGYLQERECDITIVIELFHYLINQYSSDTSLVLVVEVDALLENCWNLKKNFLKSYAYNIML